MDPLVLSLEEIAADVKGNVYATYFFSAYVLGRQGIKYRMITLPFPLCAKIIVRSPIYTFRITQNNQKLSYFRSALTKQTTLSMCTDPHTWPVALLNCHTLSGIVLTSPPPPPRTSGSGPAAIRVISNKSPSLRSLISHSRPLCRHTGYPPTLIERATFGDIDTDTAKKGGNDEYQ